MTTRQENWDDDLSDDERDRAIDALVGGRDGDDDDSFDGEREGGVEGNAVLVAVQEPASVVFPAFRGRKIPFPNVTTEAGKQNGYQLLKLAKRIGWDKTVKHDRRILCWKSRRKFGLVGRACLGSTKTSRDRD